MKMLLLVNHGSSNLLKGYEYVRPNLVDTYADTYYQSNHRGIWTSTAPCAARMPISASSRTVWSYPGSRLRVGTCVRCSSGEGEEGGDSEQQKSADEKHEE